MIKKLFYFPQKPTQGDYRNPYSRNYIDSLQQHFDIIDKNGKRTKLKSWGLLKFSTKADIYILNWVETLPHLKFGLLQFLVTLAALFLIKVRRSRVIWMFHNIHPHQGENWMTKCISRWLFHNSSIIISHSQEAADYAKQQTTVKVLYRCHPIKPIDIEPQHQDIAPIDIFIWGTILPYKGVAEFLEEKKIQESDLRIKVIGECKDKTLDQRIRNCENSHISYENRRASFSELAAYCKKSKYVLFPYIGECVSSSGVLIDTLAMGGFPIGPERGAFIDLKNEGICKTFSSILEIVDIVKTSEKNLATLARDKFIIENSWDTFGQFVKECLEANYESLQTK